MIRRTFLILSAVVALTLLSTSTAWAQTDSQKFTVRVLPVISIASPADVVLPHSTTDEDQAFPEQDWKVSCNSADGASVTLETQSAFTNGKFERDAQLDLRVLGGSAGHDWKVGVDSATTKYPSATKVSVTASSSKPGSASLGLRVTLIDNSYDDLAAGDYEMTVLGTISAN